MKETELRLLYHEMQGEMNLAFQKLVKTLSFVLALENEANANAESEEPVLNEESEDRIQQNWEILESLLSNLESSKKLSDTLDLYGIFTDETINDIIRIFALKEDLSSMIVYSYELDDVRMNAMFFYEFMLSCYRLIALLEDEADGIQEYGLSCYLVDGNEQGISVLDGNEIIKDINHTGHKDLEIELAKFIEAKALDYSDESEEKNAMQELLKHLSKVCKGKENRK